MADATNVDFVFKGQRHVTVRLSGLSDGTGESQVKKVDLQDLTFSDGLPPDALIIEDVEYGITGYTSVELLFDRDPTPVSAIRLSAGEGKLSYQKHGGLQDPQRDQAGTGNLLLTSNGATNGDMYEILLHMRMKRL